ncbi:MAG TPA: iron-sulfur cluster assembly accessory protein [Bacillales bacterium]|nr:iron-sulfur cluster assembly accessory protein [Bacillales bacterium]
MITLTEAAGEQIKDMMKAEGSTAKFLRFGVKGGGCSGLSYGLSFDDEIRGDDTELDIQGLKILIDADSRPLVQGTKIDYKQNMMGGGFVIDNPNALLTCGCGSSFKTATNEGTPEKC